jgi:hypothetical protein
MPNHVLQERRITPPRRHRLHQPARDRFLTYSGWPLPDLVVQLEFSNMDSNRINLPEGTAGTKPVGVALRGRGLTVVFLQLQIAPF